MNAEFEQQMLALQEENRWLREELERKNREEDPLQNRASAVSDSLPMAVALAATSQNATDIQQAHLELKRYADRLAQSNAELQVLTQKLERSNFELQEFANIASHDLQEPLRKVQSFGDRLLTKYRDQLDEQGRDYLDRMLSATKRMQIFINDLLTYSRVTTKVHPFSTVDLDGLLQEVLSDLEVRIEQTGGRVEADPLTVIDADAVQVRQLFQNLIGNALKFHKKDHSPSVHIWGEFVEPNPNDGDQKCYRISIQDDGIGFEEKYRDRIFAVFQRLHGRSEYEGTGIGLSVCKKIVERHRGTIVAESTPGAGSTFVVTLPVRQPEQVAL